MGNSNLFAKISIFFIFSLFIGNSNQKCIAAGPIAVDTTMINAYIAKSKWHLLVELRKH